MRTAIMLVIGLLQVLVVLIFSPTWLNTAVLLLFSGWLGLLALIDLNTQQLPDRLTLPLLWVGLAWHIYSQPVFLQQAVLGAMAGYLVLWACHWLFFFATGRQGLGYGDFKLLAALGAWVGWIALPVVLLVASLLGLLAVLLRRVCYGLPWSQRLPFGPALALAGWGALLWPFATGINSP